MTLREFIRENGPVTVVVPLTGQVESKYCYGLYECKDKWIVTRIPYTELAQNGNLEKEVYWDFWHGTKASPTINVDDDGNTWDNRQFLLDVEKEFKEYIASEVLNEAHKEDEAKRDFHESETPTRRQGPRAELEELGQCVLSLLHRLRRIDKLDQPPR